MRPRRDHIPLTSRIYAGGVRGVAIIVLATIAASGGGAAAQFAPTQISWADAKHGWIAYPDFRCRPKAALCATEKGGKTWHGIWLGIGGEIFAYKRTSTHAGLFVDRNGTWWTRDNGLHWYQTDRILGSGWIPHPGELIVGGGGISITRVRPWPPRGRARCPVPFNNGSLPHSGIRFRRNVCPAVVNADMHTQQLAQIRADEGIVELVAVPAGAAGIGWYCECDASSFEFFLWRPDGFVDLDLSVPDRFVTGVPAIRVSWPDVFVLAKAYEGPSHAPTATIDVVWHSSDGGRTFTRTASG